MYLLVGLGNIGREYEKTRHNFGFIALDKILEKFNFVKKSNKFNSELFEGTINGIKIISPLNTEVPSSGGFLPRLISGTDKVGVYHVSVTFPTKASGGVSGQYKILLSIFDAKSNWTGWVTLGTFSVTE